MLRFVHHQNRGETSVIARDQKIVQFEKQRGFRRIRYGETEIESDVAKKFNRRQPGVEHICKCHVRLSQQFQQAAHQ